MMNTMTSPRDSHSGGRDSAPRSVTGPDPTGALTQTLTAAGVLLAVYGLLVCMTLGYRITLAAVGG